MKKSPFTIMLACLTAIIITNQASAQNNYLATRSATAKKIEHANFKQPSTLSYAVLDRKEINVHALRDFIKMYDIESETWLRSADGVMATFQMHDTRYAVYYNESGHRMATIKTYEEKLMDRHMRTLVKDKYFDFQIKAVQEVIYGDEALPTYIVTIQRENQIIWVRIKNGDIDVYKEF